MHINGERAYKKSFRNEFFELAPREVKIEELTLIQWDQINGIIEIKIKCSAGTYISCLLYTSPSPRDGRISRMPSSA